MAYCSSSIKRTGFSHFCQFTLQGQQALVQNGGFAADNLSGWQYNPGIYWLLGDVIDATSTVSTYVHSGE